MEGGRRKGRNGSKAPEADGSDRGATPEDPAEGPAADPPAVAPRPRRTKATADRRDLAQKRVVQAIRPGSDRAWVWDVNRPGFGLETWPSGKRQWVYKYRTLEGTDRRMVLGDADVLTPHQAGEIFKQAAAEVSRGGDPLLAKKQARQQRAVNARGASVITVADAADRYLARLVRDRSARHATESARLWAKHVAPVVGALPLAELTAAAVQRLHESMRDTPILANRILALVSAVVARADKDGHWPAGFPNPVQRVDRYPERSRDRYVTAAEWPRLADALAAFRVELAEAPPWDTRPAQVAALLLIMLTGARKEAVLQRRWEDLDTAEAVLTVTPAQKGVTAIVLGRAALAWLATWRDQLQAMYGPEAVRPSAFMFPGQARAGKRSAPISTVDVAWHVIRHRADIADVRPHDLRRTFATVGGDVGLTDHVVGGLLGHVVPGVTGRYAKRAPEVLRDAADKVSSEVARRLRLLVETRG
jgi:integrase